MSPEGRAGTGRKGAREVYGKVWVAVSVYGKANVDCSVREEIKNVHRKVIEMDDESMKRLEEQ